MKTPSLQLEAKPNSKQGCLGLGLLCFGICNCNPFSVWLLGVSCPHDLFPMGCISLKTAFCWQSTVLWSLRWLLQFKHCGLQTVTNPSSRQMGCESTVILQGLTIRFPPSLLFSYQAANLLFNYKPLCCGFWSAYSWSTRQYRLKVAGARTQTNYKKKEYGFLLH